MEKLIVQPLQRSTISVVIVIDALDECKDEEPASAILSVLGRFVSKLSRVKFFLTGRPEPRIRNGFRLPLLERATDIFVLHEVNLSQVTSDIKKFLRSSFLELAHYWPRLGNWPSEAELDILCKRAAGLFVYAVATVKFISSKSNNPKKRLDLLLKLPDNTTYEGKTKFNATTTLDLLYTSILQEAFSDNIPEDDAMVRFVLSAVVFAANPLSLPAIAILLGLDIEDVTPLLSSIHSLLVIPENMNHPVRPFHKSFPDFITDSTWCTNERFLISPHHNQELVLCCFRLMNQKLERNMCNLSEGVMNSEVNDLEERREQYIDHALQYACKLWHRHLIDKLIIHRAEIIPALHDFLEKRFLCWLEVLSVFGSVRSAIDALRATVKWLGVSPAVVLTIRKF